MKWFGLAVISFLLSSCSPVGKLYFFTDAYFYRAYPDFWSLAPNLVQSQGFTWSPQLLPPFTTTLLGLELFTEELDSDKDLVVLSPLLTTEYFEKFREAYPEVRIILLHGEQSLSFSPTKVVQNNRKEAMAEAGRVGSIWMEARGPEAIAGAFFNLGSESRSQEKDIFLESWKEKISTDKILSTDLYRQGDLDLVKQQMGAISRNEVIQLIVAFSGAQNSFILLQSDNPQVAILTEDWQDSPFKSSQVLGSVEWDWKSGLELAIKEVTQDIWTPLDIPAKFIKNSFFNIAIQENTIP